MAPQAGSGVADDLVQHHGHLLPTSVVLGAVEAAGADWDQVDLSRAGRDASASAPDVGPSR